MRRVAVWVRYAPPATRSTKWDLYAVAERLGDTVEVAMSTYAHLYPNKMEQVAADLNRQMVPKNETPAAVILELEKVEKEHKN